MTNQVHIPRTSTIILIIICAALICYTNSFRAPFLWDDEVLILRNHYIKDLSYLPTIFTTTHFQGGGEGGNFYRPLQIVSYLFDYTFWKLNPLGFHLTNFIFHCLAAVAVYFLIAKISADNLIGFLSALIFAVHPVHTEAVTYIAGRADPQATAFLLFALLMFIKAIESSSTRRYLCWAGANLFYILALLSKESALIFLFLTIFYGLCFGQKRKIKPQIPIYVSFLLISGIYIFVKLAFLGFSPTRSLSLIAQASGFVRLLTIPKIWLTYLGLLIFPIHLHMERHFLFTSVADPYFWLGLILLFLTVWLLKLTYGMEFQKEIPTTENRARVIAKRFFCRRRRVAFFYSGWFVISLLPFLNMVPLNATCAEHWLYLPAVGFWALGVTLSVRFFRQSSEKFKKIILTFSCFLLLFYCVRTIMRNFQWRNPLALYAHDLKYSPNSFLLHNNLGVELFRWGRIDEAGREFEAAIQISPHYATSRNNLGVVLENQGKIDEAIVEYQAAIELNNYILAFGNLNRIYLKLNQPGKAAAILEKGKQLYPQISPWHHLFFMLSKEK
ncbi:MAG: tetratricopeptide repeat protein [Candidatus Omnitrophica bacterium]|nr:tetratricopeptide repeat protein [Candidatus Omnitrophota bacterium]